MEASAPGGAALAREPSGDILARIERVWEAGGADARGFILASDADGTLWSGDVGIDLFEAFLAARGARDEAEEALRREAEVFGIDAGPGAHAAAEALYEAFKAERYPEDRAFATMSWAFAGWTEDEVGAFAERVLVHRGIEARVHRQLLPIFAWARERGVPVWVVSASPRAIVVRGVSRLDIGPERVVAMTPAIRGGRIAPELGEPPVYGEGKARAIERAAPSQNVIAAFGDSAYDAAMLRLARVPVAVGPSPKLLALAPTIPGLVELET